ncbi:hypothetical protein GQ600_19012 [Phytophthora cactorum]|nr:hypothetical protein GQ600_19012 [Phytophthora cactorum]
MAPSSRTSSQDVVRCVRLPRDTRDTERWFQVAYARGGGTDSSRSSFGIARYFNAPYGHSNGMGGAMGGTRTLFTDDATSLCCTVDTAQWAT